MDQMDVIDRAEEDVEYLDLLGRELTSDVRRDAYKTALRASYALSRRGVRVDPDLAQNMLGDAISDTAAGTRRWRPEQCTLLQHLCGVIRSQASILAEHHRRFPRVEAANDEEQGGGVVVADSGNGSELSALRDLARRVLAPLYDAANDNNDPHVVQVLDAYSEGITKRAEVAEHAGMTVKDFDRARDRLNRMIGRLPDELRGAMTEMLGRRV